MCGIVGVMGASAAEKAFGSLKCLEYRGYDSWGIALPDNGSFYVEKHIGKIGGAELNGHPQGNIAIAHTRWATHGKVLERNAHPHLSNDGKIAIVHNGIVENFTDLKESLIKKGFKFVSDTDSEVIANLIELHSKGNSFEEAVRLSLLELNGSYAVVCLKADENKIVCARSGSPLVLGIGKNGEFFVGSDATAFIEHTNTAVFLNDGEMAVLSGNLSVLDVKSGNPAQFTPKELKWNFEQAKKGDYPHFMLKEIYEQPDAILAASEQPEEKITEMSSLMRGAEKIFLTGCGSSYHACICGSYFLSKICGISVTPILSSEFSQHEQFFNKKTLVIGVSQSGETADLLEALKAAKSRGAKIGSIVNVMDSSVMRFSDCSLLMNAGPEICVLSTKSFTSQLSILLLLAYSLAGKFSEGKELLRKTSALAQKHLPLFDVQMKSLAKSLSRSKDLFVIGRHDAFAAALESALKIKEVSYIHAEGFAGGELKHGTIALVEEGTPAIALSTPETRPLTLSNAIEMKSRGAKIIGVDSKTSAEYDESIQVPDVQHANPIMLVLPIQLLAYYLAVERNLDPDKPRNLAKSVTVK